MKNNTTTTINGSKLSEDQRITLKAALDSFENSLADERPRHGVALIRAPETQQAYSKAINEIPYDDRHTRTGFECLLTQHIPPRLTASAIVGSRSDATISDSIRVQYFAQNCHIEDATQYKA